MASATAISISVHEYSLFDQKQLDSESAAKASEVLQENHEAHHILFNPLGLHNHIVHDILTLYALGASPSNLEQHYLINKKYQRPRDAGQEAPPNEGFGSLEEFKSHLHDEKQYSRYLHFFEEEISDKGWEPVVQRYLFQGDELADDLLETLFTIHPLIHVSYGIEFKQPAIIAEGLALTSIHQKSIGKFVSKTEVTSRNVKPNARKPLASIIAEIYADETVRAATKWDEPRKFANGPCQKAEAEMLRYAAQWKASAEDFEEKMAEIFNCAALVAGAAQRPPKVIKLDFFLIHGLTTSHSLRILLQQEWISKDVKVRLVNYMGWLLLADYAGCGSPELHLEELVGYKPKQAYQTDDLAWNGLIKRAIEVEDDGHTVKFVRALMHGRILNKGYSDRKWCIVNDKMWVMICHMCVDSVEVENPARWVRLAGFAEAWEAFPDREKQLDTTQNVKFGQNWESFFEKHL